jgi:NADH-quinone oxidoreductase subunit B
MEGQEKRPYSDAAFMDSKQEMDLLVSKSLAGREVKPNVLFANLEKTTKALSSGMVKWSRKNSLWPMQFGLACCAIELMDFGSSRIDAERRGFLMFRATPRQCDVMIVAGWVTKSIVPEIKRLYEQMLSPKYVIAYGECATCGGPWFESYNIMKGIDQVLPVDVYVAGCPPKPENLFGALVKLQKKVGGEVEV